MDAGTIFRLGEQKLLKNNQDNQIQNNNFMQYVGLHVFFEKKVYAVYNGVWDKASEVGEFLRICVKSNLTVCKEL